ncbi:carbohydrate kinase [Chloroflexales bacterium ZM16-3]|nr:carbohydrate kinase [Chloroflexales bacterium ZM16-3]
MTSTQHSAFSGSLFAGIDVGTQGVRVVVADARGEVRARSSAPLATDDGPGGRSEQRPDDWWLAAAACLRAATASLGSEAQAIAALAVTATSGTVCLLDAGRRAVAPAIMYRDRRAVAEAAELNRAAAALCGRLGYRFDASFGLPKLLWLRRHAADLLDSAAHICHAADLIVGRLTGDYATTDWSHALKSGYDLIDLRWPEELLEPLGLPLKKLPRVIAPADPIAQVSPAAAEATGLPATAIVVAGMSDGCAAQIAGGAAEPGQWLSVLGTTLVLKGVSAALPHDPQGRVYAHRHPDGHWLPGAASSTGGAALAARFPGADLAALDARAAAITPGQAICYPLEGRGERFPFVAPQAEGFLLGAGAGGAAEYTAILEGVAYLERLAFAELTGLGYAVEGPVRAAGGGARSPVWLQIRADVLGRSLLVPREVEAAFGAAVIAAAALAHPGLGAATRAMSHARAEVAPRPDAARYDEPYDRFLEELRRRGYLAER